MAARNDASKDRRQESVTMDPGDMAEIVQRARSVDAAELRSAGNKHHEDAEAEATRTCRVVDATSGGNAQRGKDTSHHLAVGTRDTPISDQAGRHGGKGAGAR